MGNYTAYAAGGNPPYSYQWWKLEGNGGAAPASSTISPNKPPNNTWVQIGTNSRTVTTGDIYNFQIKCVVTDANRNSATSNIIYVTISGAGNIAANNPGADAVAAEIPANSFLSQNYPNPFNPSTQIRLALTNQVHVKLVVYDMLGREVARLADEDMDAGYHSVTWNASNVSSGVYIYRLSAGNFVQVRRMVVMK